MKQQVENLKNWFIDQPIKGCITGSCLLDYFEGQDVDLFVYDEKSFINIVYAMKYNKMFTILNPLEDWKFEQYLDKGSKVFSKFDLITIKFLYNTCIIANVTYKMNKNNSFSVLSSFDMNIICKAYDIETKQTLDLTENSNKTKLASWNKWNTSYYDVRNIWTTSRILRQLDRCFKYHKRGYNTDEVVLKYMSLIDGLLEYESIFKSINFNERLEELKKNANTLKNICNIWLEKHEISDEELELLQKTILQYDN